MNDNIFQLVHCFKLEKRTVKWRNLISIVNSVVIIYDSGFITSFGWIPNYKLCNTQYWIHQHTNQTIQVKSTIAPRFYQIWVEYWFWWNCLTAQFLYTWIYTVVFSPSWNQVYVLLTNESKQIIVSFRQPPSRSTY